jgi:5-methylcytosine-specific restriction endonuclease McrA
MQKLCRKCGAFKELHCFHHRSSSPDGHVSYCKTCKAAADKASYPSRSAIKLAYAKTYRETHHEECKAAIREHYKKNKERYIEQGRLWRMAHPERDALMKRAWVDRNPERRKAVSRMASHRRRALMRKTQVAAFTIDDVAARCSVFGDLCAYCGGGERMTIDHVIPISRGGPHILANLRPACQRCNFSKHKKKLGEWTPPVRRAG